jgi:hypothetical protein
VSLILLELPIEKKMKIDKKSITFEAEEELNIFS